MNNTNLNNKTIEIVSEKYNACVNCKLCFEACPMMKEYSSSPKELMGDIIEHKSVDKNIPYSCICYVSLHQSVNVRKLLIIVRPAVIEPDGLWIADAHALAIVGNHALPLFLRPLRGLFLLARSDLDAEEAVLQLMAGLFLGFPHFLYALFRINAKDIVPENFCGHIHPIHLFLFVIVSYLLAMASLLAVCYHNSKV